MHHRLSPQQSELALRALASCARADGALTENERALIDAAAALLGMPAGAVDQLEPVTVEEVARALPEPRLREQLLQALLLMPLMDGEVTPAEAAFVARFATGLSISEPRVANLEQLAQGRLKTLWLDLARRSFARPIFEKALRERGLPGVWKIVGPMLGLARDGELVSRYLELGRLPEHTLGYGYFRFIVDNELGFPGEGAVAEDGVWHDLTHVLAGYDTSPVGEVNVVSFIAGYVKEDPFFWLFTIALQFHLGIKVSPFSPGMRGFFAPEAVSRAFQRGLQVKRDLSKDWDFWADLGRPLADVRAELGVPVS